MTASNKPSGGTDFIHASSSSRRDGMNKISATRWFIGSGHVTPFLTKRDSLHLRVELSPNHRMDNTVNSDIKRFFIFNSEYGQREGEASLDHRWDRGGSRLKIQGRFRG